MMQAILIVACTSYGLIQHDYTALYGYFAVGIWQVLSFFMHYLFTDRRYLLLKQRRLYGITLLILLGATALGMLDAGALILVLILMLFFTPVVAIAYCCICCKEVKLMSDGKE